MIAPPNTIDDTDMMFHNNANSIKVNTGDINSIASNDKLNKVALEIRVYP